VSTKQFVAKLETKNSGIQTSVLLFHNSYLGVTDDINKKSLTQAMIPDEYTLIWV